jgi:hypothetical protein
MPCLKLLEDCLNTAWIPEFYLTQKFAPLIEQDFPFWFEKFWSITQMPMDDDNKTIVARSFAYIGHILTKRESLVQSGEQTFELSKIPVLVV